MKKKLFSTLLHTGQEMKFSIKDFSSKCDQIHRKLLIWLHLLEKSLMENFIFCAVTYSFVIYQQPHIFYSDFTYFG